MRKQNSKFNVSYISEKGADEVNRTYFAYIPLENMVCYAVAESFDNDNDLNSAKIAVEAVLVEFERNPSFRNLKSYIKYANDQIRANSVKNRLEAAITVVLSDYTRIQYASCGNIKLYLLSEDAFYLRSDTQTYYQFAADEYGPSKAPIEENKNLLQYLGKRRNPKTFISKKVLLLEESTMLFATGNVWERVDDVEILDVYEESKPEEFIPKLEELFLFTQLKDSSIRSYATAAVFIEKAFKEDTAKKKKRRRIIIAVVIILSLLAIIAAIVLSIIRAGDRRAMNEINRLDSEGIRFSNFGNYSMAYEQYEKAREQTSRLVNNWQYRRQKQELTDSIAEKWHFFNSIMVGDKSMESGDYHGAKASYEDADAVYYNVYRETGAYTELSDKKVSEILSNKIKQTENHIAANDLIEEGEMYVLEEMYSEALKCFIEAEEIIKTMGNLDLRRKVLQLIREAEINENRSVEEGLIRQVREFMGRAEENLEYETALSYAEFIIRTYSDMGNTNDQSQEDKARIERKLQLDKDATDHLNLAVQAEEGTEYDEAIRNYEIMMELYKEMGIGVGHEKYRGVMNEVSRIEKIKEEIRQQEEEAQKQEALAQAQREEEERKQKEEEDRLKEEEERQQREAEQKAQEEERIKALEEEIRSLREEAARAQREEAARAAQGEAARAQRDRADVQSRVLSEINGQDAETGDSVAAAGAGGR